MSSELHAVLEIDLVYPYKTSCDVLLRFVTEWNARILSLGTQKPVAVIAIRWQGYKLIWGRNPKRGIVEVPAGAEDFMQSVTVIDVKSF